MGRSPAVSAMPMALIGRIIASVRVDYVDTMSTEHFAVRQSRVGPMWPFIKASLEPFLIKKTEVGPPYTKFMDGTVRARVGISRETLEKRLEKTPTNTRFFRTRLVIDVFTNPRRSHGHRTWCR